MLNQLVSNDVPWDGGIATFTVTIPWERSTMREVKEVFLVEPSHHLSCEIQVCGSEQEGWQAMQDSFESILDDHELNRGDTEITITTKHRWVTLEAWERFKKDCDHDGEAMMEGIYYKTKEEAEAEYCTSHVCSDRLVNGKCPNCGKVR